MHEFLSRLHNAVAGTGKDNRSRWPQALRMSTTTHNKTSAAMVVAFTICAAATVVLGPAPAHAAPVCSGVNAPTLDTVTPNTYLNNLFTSYGNSTSTGWTGADSTYSVALPNNAGRLWLFSDTFLGPVNADGSRPGTAPFIRNSFVHEYGFSVIDTYYDGPYGTSSGVVPHPAQGSWYWVGQGTISGSQLQVPLHEWSLQDTNNDGDTSDPFDFAWVSNKLARFALSDLSHATSVVALPSASNVQWGVWVQQHGGYTYVYGVEDLGLAKYMRVARVWGTSLTGTWRYYRGGSWTSGSSWSWNESNAVRLSLGSTSYGVSNEYSVHRLGSNLWVLITMDTTVGSENGDNFSDDIVAYFSCTPVGPFVAKTFLYDTPETGPSPPYNFNPDVWTYNPHSHPEFITSSDPGRLTISYNVNSSGPGDVYEDASIYRPRFITVDLNGVS